MGYTILHWSSDTPFEQLSMQIQMHFGGSSTEQPAPKSWHHAAFFVERGYLAYIVTALPSRLLYGWNQSVLTALLAGCHIPFTCISLPFSSLQSGPRQAHTAALTCPQLSLLTPGVEELSPAS